jgi:exopolysaccharide/PEP-CTERM locus tyrosine autokinase
MGKYSDALEKHKKNSLIQAEPLFRGRDIREPKPSEPKVPAMKFPAITSWDPKLIAISAPDSVDAENYKILRGQILFAKGRERPRTIMVTSALPNEGKTHVAANLAISIALGIDEYVLLIDCDLRKSGVHKMFGYTNKEGLHEYLTGEKAFQDLVIRTGLDKLSILLAGSVPQNPAELLSSSMMENFLKEAGQRYKDRIIIIDSPPAQVTAETGVLAKYVDAIIIVAMAQKTPRVAIQKTVNLLGKDKLLGIVFNGFNPVRRMYKSYYDKYYR